MTLIRDALRGQPNVDITFDSDLALDGLVGVCVKQNEFLHDVAELYLRGAKMENLAVYSGHPIHIVYGRDSALDSFAGYVTDVKPTYHSNELLVDVSNYERPHAISGVTVVCFGASTRMRDAATRMWQNRTIPSVVAEIVEKYRFSSTIEAHSFVWPSIVQDGIRDWEMLTKLANMIGYRFTLTGTHLRFYDPLAALQRPNVVPTIATSANRLTGVEPGTLTLREFKPNFTAQSESGFSGEIHVHGVDDLGQSFDMSTASLYEQRPELGSSRPYTTAVKHLDATSTVRSAEEVRVLLDAERRKHAWPITAELVCNGSPHIRVGHVVNITGFAAEYDGAWYVLDVEHEMEHGSYLCRARVGKDATGPTERVRPNQLVPKVPATIRILNDWVAVNV